MWMLCRAVPDFTDRSPCSFHPRHPQLTGSPPGGMWLTHPTAEQWRQIIAKVADARTAQAQELQVRLLGGWVYKWLDSMNCPLPFVDVFCHRPRTP